MRLLHTLLLLPLVCTPVLAQTAPPAATEHHGRRTAEEHFAAANTTRDGRLTLEQAKAGYKSIAKSFDQIDINRRGYVTMDDIKAWRAAKKAARQAAKQAAEASGTGMARPTPAFQRGLAPRAVDTSANEGVPPPRIGVDLPNTPMDGRHPS